MRVLILVLAAAALAGPAAAQSAMTMTPQPPPQAYEQRTQMAPLPTQHDRYLMKLASLRDRTIRIKAKDGGQLTPDHAAALQQQLDALNHQFGVTAG